MDMKKEEEEETRLLIWWGGGGGGHEHVSLSHWYTILGPEHDVWHCSNIVVGAGATKCLRKSVALFLPLS